MTVTEKGAYRGVVPYIAVSSAKEAAALYEQAWAAEIIDTRPVEDGRLMHCEMIINGNAFMLCDTFPEYGMTETGAGSCTLHITVDDVQAWWDRARAAGLEVTEELHDAFWGDRYGQLKDRFGLKWALVGPKE